MKSAGEANTFLGRIALALLVFTISAFGLKVAVQPETFERYTPIVIFHAVAMIAWLSLLASQSYLAARGSFELHRAFGRASPFLVLAMVGSGVLISFGIGAELGRYEVTVVNVAAFVTFTPLYLVAVHFARQGKIHIHRQAMLIGTLALMTPAYARIVQVAGLPDPLAIVMQLPITIALASWFDWKVLGRISKPVLAMLAFSIAVIGAMGAVLVVFFLPALIAQIEAASA
ncbi:MAG: hypothetical protein AAF697_07230 [Pseudomonadota bacterium]